jgi:hybrid cluster-associated redox disulfide protein
MLYYKISQPVPGKGDAWVYYECDEKFNISRQMTHIPATGETDCVPNPLVKRMTNMAWMEKSSKEEFDGLWSDEHIKHVDHAVPAGAEGMQYFSLDMTIGEAMSIHPRVAEVFAAFHLGGCSHCGINQYETIGQVCAGYGVDADMLLEVLEDLMRPEQEQKEPAGT